MILETLLTHSSMSEYTRLTDMDDNETKVAVLYGRIIVAALAILITTWQLDVEIPVIV